MIKKIAVILLALLLPGIVLASSDKREVKELEHTIHDMTDSWNSGNMNDFLNYYKKSDSATFVSSKIINGYKNISERYESEYPANDVMGKLSISHLKIKVISPTYAMAIGDWSQTRQDIGKRSGTFSLLWEKTTDGWKIVVDHTS